MRVCYMHAQLLSMGMFMDSEARSCEFWFHACILISHVKSQWLTSHHHTKIFLTCYDSFFYLGKYLWNLYTFQRFQHKGFLKCSCVTCLNQRGVCSVDDRNMPWLKAFSVIEVLRKWIIYTLYICNRIRWFIFGVLKLGLFVVNSHHSG
jgi:hypothetical protein